MHNKPTRSLTLPFRTTAIATALLMFSGQGVASQLIANGSTQNANGDYSTSSTGTAGYSLWANNNGVINSDNATALSISSALSSAIVAQSGGKITLGGNGLGRFNVTAAGSGSSVILVSGANSQVSLTGADASINLGSPGNASSAYGVSLTGSAALNLTDSTLAVTSNSGASGGNVYGIRSTGNNNRITLNNVTLNVAGTTSSSYSESTSGISLDNGSTLTGNKVTATVSSSASSDGKAVLDAKSGAQANLSNIQFTGRGPVVGGAYAIGGNASVTLNSGTISVNGYAGAYNANSAGTINAYGIDVIASGTSGATGGSSSYDSMLNLVGGSITTTSGNASILSAYRATVKLQDTALTMNYGTTNNSNGYLFQSSGNGLIDANHIAATVQDKDGNGSVKGINALSGGRVNLYNNSRIDLKGYTVNYAGTLLPSYGALIDGANTLFDARDSTIAITAPRDAVIGIQTQKGGTATLTNMNVSTSGAASYSHALRNTDATSSMTVNGGSFSTAGGYSNAVDAEGGSLITVNGAALSTSGSAAPAVAALGGSTIKLTNGSITTGGGQSFGIYQQDNLSTRNTVTADGTTITTTGNFAAGVFNRFNNTVNLTNVGINTSGTEAYGLLSSSASSTVPGGVPVITAEHSTITTRGSGAHAAVVNDGGTLTLTNNSTLSTQGAGASALKGGAELNSLGGTDYNAANQINISGSTLQSALAAAISIEGKKNTLNLTDSTVTGDSGLALAVQSGEQDGFALAGQLTLTANHSTLNGAITMAADGSSANVTLNNGSQWNVGGNSNMTQLTLDNATVRYTAAASLNTDITLGNGGAVFDTNGYNAVYTGTMDGNGNLTKQGLGTFTLNGINALGYSGDTFINDGVLALRGLSASDAASLSKTFTLNGGWLDLSDTVWTGNDADANDWAHLTIASGANAAAGGVIGSDDKVTYNIATGNTETIDYQIGKADGDKNGLYLVKSGDGTLTLNHANEYKGYTRIDGGTLQINADNNLGDTALAREVILNGGNLQISADLSSQRALELRQNGSLIVDGGVSATWNGGVLESGGSFDFSKDGDGTLILVGSASQSGATIVNSGTLQTGAANLFNSNDSMQIAAGATVDLQSYNQQINQLSGDGQLQLGSASAMLNNQRDSQFDGLISGDGNLIKTGDATLTLSQANTYTGDTLIAGGTLHAAGDDIIAASRSVTIDGAFDLDNSTQHVNQLSGSGQTHLGSGQLFAHNDADTVFSGVIDGSGSVYKDGDGALTLNNQHRYTGLTEVRHGTLIVGDAQHNNASLNSSLVEVAAGATFGGYGATAGDVNNQGTLAVADALPQFSGGASGDFTVGGNLGNSGRIVMASAVPNSRLIVNGNYNGQGGTLELSTVLGGDDSATDKLLVRGSTSGNTGVIVNGIGDTGAQTVNGIRIIEVGGASDGVFALNNRVVAGPYEYNLYKGLPDGSGGDWYLRSSTADGGGGDTPNWRPEIGAYLANQYLAGAMQVHTLYDRQGAQYGNRSGNVWGRVVGGRNDSSAADGRIDQHSDYSLLHIGGDSALFGNNNLRLGAMGSWGSARTHANAQGSSNNASGDLDGLNLGIYATWYADADTRLGAYADSWLQYGWYKNKVNGNGIPSDKYDSHAFSASLETGYSMILSGDTQRSLRLTPQLQAVYSQYRADRVTEQNGTVIDSNNGNSWQTRAGLRLSGQGLYNGRQVQPYVEANWLHASNDQAVSFNGTNIAQGVPRDRAELKAGLQGQISKNWDAWAHVGMQLGESDYRQFEGMAGFSYRW